MIGIIYHEEFKNYINLLGSRCDLDCHCSITTVDLMGIVSKVSVYVFKYAPSCSTFPSFHGRRH